MKTKKIKAVVLFLALCFLLPSMVSAVSYKDIPQTDWAYTHITKLSDKGIIHGYPDGTFKKDKDVTYLEVIKLLAGVMKLNVEELGKARSTYGATVDAANVPDWAQDSVATALYKKVITPEELTKAKELGLVDNNPQQVPDRNTIAMYFGKGLGLKKTTDFSNLKHKDIDAIPLSTKEYLAPLVKAGIFEPTGSDGNFEGNRAIRRGEMAKIIVEARKAVPKEPKVEDDKKPVTILPEEQKKNINTKDVIVNLREGEPAVDALFKIEDFIPEMKTTMLALAKANLGKNYEILGQRFEGEVDYKKYLPYYVGRYIVIAKNYDRDPDTVPYIKKAKEEKDPTYEIYKKEYLQPQEFAYENVKIVKTYQGEIVPYLKEDASIDFPWRNFTFR